MMGGHLPLHILLTKSDKLSRAAVSRAQAKVEAQLTGSAQSVSILSTVTRQGLEALERKCREWLA